MAHGIRWDNYALAHFFQGIIVELDDLILSKAFVKFVQKYLKEKYIKLKKIYSFFLRVITQN